MRPVGLFGKLRSAGDFVGLHAEGDAPALQRWLQHGHDEAAGRLVVEPVYFVSEFPGSSVVYCGSWIASQDSVGRPFPLASFVPLPAELTRVSRGFLPAVLQPFLDGTVQAMSSDVDRPYEEVKRALADVPRPDPSLLPRATEQCGQACREESVSTFVRRVFGDGGEAQLAYAMHAIERACAALRTRHPPVAPVSLDCPMVIDLDLFFWADLIHRSLRWKQHGPGVFWTEETPRLAVSLGPATTAMIAQLSSEQSTSAFWPLRTDRADALDLALRGLPDCMRAVLQSDGSLDTLLACAS